MTILGVDFSQWGGDLAPQTVECWKNEGVRFAIVQYSSRIHQHLQTLVTSGGINLEAYVYLYWNTSPWNQTPQDRTESALRLIQGFPVQRLWLDAEDTTHPYREDQLRECVALCEAAGVPTGIYTGSWWWRPQTNNSSAFAHLPLWHAEYLQSGTARPNFRPDFGAFQPYGGWTRPLIWQYQGTTMLCGHSVDLNALEHETSQPLPPSPEPPPTLEEIVWACSHLGVLTALGQTHRLHPGDRARVQYALDHMEEWAP